MPPDQLTQNFLDDLRRRRAGQPAQAPTPPTGTTPNVSNNMWGAISGGVSDIEDTGVSKE